MQAAALALVLAILSPSLGAVLCAATCHEARTPRQTVARAPGACHFHDAGAGAPVRASAAPSLCHADDELARVPSASAPAGLDAADTSDVVLLNPRQRGRPAGPSAMARLRPSERFTIPLRI